MNRIWTAIVVILCSGMLFFQSALAEAGDLKIVRPESMTIVDRTGKTLGPFTLQFGTFSYAVLFSVKGRIFKLGVNRDGYRADDYLWFESPDCTGPPLMRQWDTILPPVALGAPGNTVYTGAAGAQPAVANLMSERVAEGCIFVGSIPISVVPAEPLIDLDTEFTPPFRIRTGGATEYKVIPDAHWSEPVVQPYPTQVRGGQIRTLQIRGGHPGVRAPCHR